MKPVHYVVQQMTDDGMNILAVTADLPDAMKVAERYELRENVDRSDLRVEAWRDEEDGYMWHRHRRTGEWVHTGSGLS